MSKPVKKIAVTGSAGQIAYSILFRIANGDVLGKDQPISLHLLDLPDFVPSLKGVAMELQDCAFPLLKDITFGSDPYDIFEGVHYAFLIGSKPRGPGMERKDLLSDNGKIFIGQGQALDAVADKDVITLVVGNPCNTNCLIASSFAKRINPKKFFAMTRLDQNRATAFLAEKSGASITEVEHVTIWGNHSATQVPDFVNAKIRGSSVTTIITDRAWLENDFTSKVQKRGAEVIATRGKSSAGSAANAAIDAMKSLVFPTEPGKWFSMALCSKGNPYGIDEGLIFSFPCISKGNGNVEIVQGVHIDPFLKQKIDLTEKELKEERSLVENLLK
ncbi:MAG: malate dehydrogenase [Chlamydiae bacterium]|nr:malate dehydrogenase [Chlamydiota bacterium]